MGDGSTVWLPRCMSLSVERHAREYAFHQES